MKILVLFLTLLSTAVYGQKQLVSVTWNDFIFISGIARQTDSTAYLYNDTLLGGMMEFAPTLEHTGNYFQYSIPTDRLGYIVHCSESKNYSGVSYATSSPLTQWKHTTNTISNGKIVETNTTNNIPRKLYTYNSDGDLILELKQSYDSISTNWITYDSTILKYDNLRNIISTEGYFIGSDFYANGVNSMFYETGTSKLIKITSHSVHNALTDLTTTNILTEISYNGDKIDYIDFFLGKGSDDLVWNQRAKYRYDQSKLTELNVYKVSGNILKNHPYSHTQ